MALWLFHASLKVWWVVLLVGKCLVSVINEKELCSWADKCLHGSLSSPAGMSSTRTANWAMTSWSPTSQKAIWIFFPFHHTETPCLLLHMETGLRALQEPAAYKGAKMPSPCFHWPGSHSHSAGGHPDLPALSLPTVGSCGTWGEGIACTGLSLISELIPPHRAALWLWWAEESAILLSIFANCTYQFCSKTENMQEQKKEKRGKLRALFVFICCWLVPPNPRQARKRWVHRLLVLWRRRSSNCPLKSRKLHIQA